MMVDLALELERQGEISAAESLSGLDDSLPSHHDDDRLRNSIMGTLPIAIGFGADADARRPLGLCVVGGLVFAQFVTLCFTPVFYTYMDNFLKWRKEAKAPAPSRESDDVRHPVPDLQLKRLGHE